MSLHRAQRPLIGICGKAGAGKDTCGSVVQAFYAERSQAVLRYSFATPLKLALGAMLGIDPKLFESPEFKQQRHPALGKTYRELLQTLGTEWGRDVVHPDCWVLLAEERIGKRARDGIGTVITDVRFNNEAKWIKEQGGALIRVIREGDGERLGSTEASHASEAGISKLYIDAEVSAPGGEPEMLCSRFLEALQGLV